MTISEPEYDTTSPSTNPLALKMLSPTAIDPKGIGVAKVTVEPDTLSTSPIP